MDSRVDKASERLNAAAEEATKLKEQIATLKADHEAAETEQRAAVKSVKDNIRGVREGTGQTAEEVDDVLNLMKSLGIGGGIFGLLCAGAAYWWFWYKWYIRKFRY